MASLESGRFDPYVAEAQRAAGRPVDVSLSALTMSPPEPGSKDEEARRVIASLPRQTVHYSFDESCVSLVADDANSDVDRLIPTTAGCHSLTELATTIQGIKQSDWMWVIVEFGLVLLTDGGRGPNWDTETVWTNACDPFLDWLR